MAYPTKVRIGDKEYPINTDYRVALECDRVARDETIKYPRKELTIIYLLFGDKGLDDEENHCKLLELGQKYLLCGQEPIDERDKEETDMDFEQDMDYIEASFMSDYNIDLTNTEMHWYKFNNLLNGLSDSEIGNCCIFNRIRNLRNYDTSQIKDIKEKQKIEKAKERVALKKKEKPLTREQQESIARFNKLAGLC
jgi:hypothetical protein